MLAFRLARPADSGAAAPADPFLRPPVINPGDPHRLETLTRPGEPEPAARRRVLLVEPCPLAREVIRLTLTGAGLDVVEPDGGPETADGTSAVGADLVLQNLAAPGPYRLVRALRAGQSQTPVLAVDNDDNRLQAARAAGVGFSGFLSRPFLPSHLLDTVGFYLGLPGGGGYVRPPAGRGSTAALPPVQGPHARFAPAGRGRTVLVAELPTGPLGAALSLLAVPLLRAATAAGALERAAGEPPAAVVCSAVLLDASAFELCLALRRHPRLADVPFLLAPQGHLREADGRVASAVGITRAVRFTDGGREVLAAVHAALAAPARVGHPGPRPGLLAGLLGRRGWTGTAL